MNDGSVNRKTVAEIVFQDNRELQWLNSVLHPMVRAVAEPVVSANNGFLMFDVPLLFEAGWHAFFDAVICVWLPVRQQIARLRQTGRWPDDQIVMRIASQMSGEEKMEKADFCIVNSGNKELLREQCIKINRRIRRIKGSENYDRYKKWNREEKRRT